MAGIHHHFDHDGSAPVRPAVRAAMEVEFAAGPPSPSGVHAAARARRAVLERSRRALAGHLGLDVAGLVFTSCGVEALATVLRGFPGAPVSELRLVASVGERPEVEVLLETLEALGASVERVALAASGRIDLDGWGRALEAPADLAFLHHANHETGLLQPVERAAAACSERDVPFLLDATWSFGRVPLPPVDATFLALSFHRAGGPPALGALWARPGVTLDPLIPGAGERGRRGGQEPVAAAAGAAALVSELAERGEEEIERIRSLRDELEGRLLEAIPEALRNGEEPRLPGTSNLSFPGLEAEALALRLDLEGFGVSVGAACSSGSTRPGPVLPAMGLGPEAVHSAVRFSLGWSTSEDEVEALAAALPGIVAEIRSAHPGVRGGSA